MTDTPRPQTVRQACRDRKPIDGVDAQALEGALSQCERDLDQMCNDYNGKKMLYENALDKILHLERDLASTQQELALVTQQALSFKDAMEMSIRNSQNLKQQLAAQSAQLVAMRCCGNCKHSPDSLICLDFDCINYSKWEGGK